MARVYTAREMRQAANAEELVGRPVVAAMLRQAADSLDREEREKKYEYKVLYRMHDGRVSDSITHTEDIQIAMYSLKVYSGHDDAHIVRRPVGEWEVLNG